MFVCVQAHACMCVCVCGVWWWLGIHGGTVRYRQLFKQAINSQQHKATSEGTTKAALPVPSFLCNHLNGRLIDCLAPHTLTHIGSVNKDWYVYTLTDCDLSKPQKQHTVSTWLCIPACEHNNTCYSSYIVKQFVYTQMFTFV